MILFTFYSLFFVLFLFFVYLVCLLEYNQRPHKKDAPAKINVNFAADIHEPNT